MELTQEAHALIGGWAIEYKPLLTQAAFDELERRVMLLIAAERERCAQLCDDNGSGFILAQLVRALP